MTDVHDKKTRSFNMSRIRSKDTKPEMIVRRALTAAGIRYRLHDKFLPGKPDIVFKKHRIAIFVHGCFWHNHPNCKHARMPRSNEVFWKSKLFKNVMRDETNRKALLDIKWEIITIWECETEKQTKILIDLLKNLSTPAIHSKVKLPSSAK